jgi:hypothetical protein
MKTAILRMGFSSLLLAQISASASPSKPPIAPKVIDSIPPPLRNCRSMAATCSRSLLWAPAPFRASSAALATIPITRSSRVPGAPVIRGRYTWTRGVDWTRFQLNYQQSNLIRGRYTYTGAFSSSASHPASGNVGCSLAYLRQKYLWAVYPARLADRQSFYGQHRPTLGIQRAIL